MMDWEAWKAFHNAGLSEKESKLGEIKNIGEVDASRLSSTPESWCISPQNR
jgi:hypothetical protein